MKYSEVEQLYKDQPITDIEATASTFQARHIDAQKSFIGALFYLERTNRYKENPVYKTADFKSYLSHRFDISYLVYNELRTVFFHFAEECKEFGVAPVRQALHKLGLEGAEKAFPKIRAAKLKRQTPMTSTDFNAVVARLATPRETVVPTKTIRDWERAYHEEHKLRLQLEEENKELRAQVARLKATVESLKRPAAGGGGSVRRSEAVC